MYSLAAIPSPQQLVFLWAKECDPEALPTVLCHSLMFWDTDNRITHTSHSFIGEHVHVLGFAILVF
jgi:hypothetical protein